MEMVRQQGLTCMVASLAMVWGCDFKDVVRLLGHDGTEKVFLASAYPRRGIHDQEVMDVAYKDGYAMMIIEGLPRLSPRDNEAEYVIMNTLENLTDRLESYIKGKYAVLIGLNSDGMGHCVAYDGDLIFDPASGRKYDLDSPDFDIDRAWLFPKITIS